MKKLGLKIYEGPSEITGEPIIALLSFRSSNEKTGDIYSLWIFDKNENPIQATKTGSDINVCGNCPHRHYTGGGCYVNLARGPVRVYRAYISGKYPFGYVPKGIKIRLGAYGDPGALPEYILQDLTEGNNFVGYTHQWKYKNLQKFSVASVDSKTEYYKAKEKGYKTYRIVTDYSEKLENEIICPNETHNVQCRDCMLCSPFKGKKDIVILKHGFKKNKVKLD